MRAGLRLQILVLLGGLLLLAFLPLYLAVATYTRLALQQIRTTHAQSLGRAVAAHVVEAGRRRSADDLGDLLGAAVGREGVEAIVVYGPDGRVLARAGALTAVDVLARELDVRREATFELDGDHGKALAVVVPAESGAVVAVLRLDDHSARAAPLLRLLGLYTALVALALLVVAYFALTRLIVRPLDALSRAAERVANGARRLTPPPTGVRELGELGTSLRTMTEKLIADEDALRRKVTEVEAATRRLSEAQDRLVRSERLASVGRLAAGLAHEIGNPIAALMGFEDLLLAGGLSRDEERDFLQRMKRETERIHGILRDLLQFARARPSGERAEPGDVAAAVTDTATLVGPQKDMKDVELRLELAPDLPLVAMSREQIVQVVLNLVLNAADAVPPGGHITIRARVHAGTHPGPVLHGRFGPLLHGGDERSEAQQEGIPTSHVELSVEDDGPGVDPAVRARLFEPFVTTKDVGEGTGLGLAVCRGLVEAVGGSITLDERYTAGARFIVDLPAA